MADRFRVVVWVFVLGNNIGLTAVAVHQGDRMLAAFSAVLALVPIGFLVAYWRPRKRGNPVRP